MSRKAVRKMVNCSKTKGVFLMTCKLGHKNYEGGKLVYVWGGAPMQLSDKTAIISD